MPAPSRHPLRLVSAAVALAALLALALRVPADEPARSAPDVRFVVMHHPGPAWKVGVDPREQPGIAEHVRHYRRLAEQGRLELGGPFLDAAAGGMMIPAAGVPEDSVRAFAAADPAVASGLLTFEVRRWYVGMKHAR